VHAASRAAAHALTFVVAVACGGERSEEPSSLPNDGSASSPFPPVVAPDDNPTTTSKIALGRLLFYDPILSVDEQVACATCHSEVWGMTDGLPVSVGHGAGLKSGPGRTGSHLGRRNAPMLWNVAFRENLFWDGRAASLEDQVHFPFESVDEFDRSFADVVIELAKIPAYERLYSEAFADEAGNSVTKVNTARALAAFERTLISQRGPYDAFVDGDPAAMNPNMISGMKLFASEGCIDCHQPPLFSSERFEDRGVPAIPGIDDAGRYEATHDERDRNRFKVPGLRNLRDTAPYFHTGAVDTIELAVRHEVERSVASDGVRALRDTEIRDLSDFISKGLMDARNAPTRPYEVPSGLPVPIDGFAIRR
jgi:cytochrome c peroxidase